MEKDTRFFWIVTFGLLLLTRVPAAAQYLSIDNVNLALSLETFDPRIHQPQPPGYPFFVGSARVFNFFLRDAERTFLFMSILVSALCLPVASALGSRMFSPWAGRAAALLLLVNPVFWHSGLDGPLRPHLALFALLTAYCAWRCWNGEKEFALWGAAALAVGSGFRPDLAAYMLPLWLLSSWMGTRSISTVFRGILLMAAIVLVWVTALAWAVGGVAALMSLTNQYLVDQSRGESLALGAASRDWMHQVGRLVVWNSLAIVGWVWAIGFQFVSKDRLTVRSAQSVFMLTWLMPGLLLQALIHVAAPGHTLFSVVGLCLIGGYCLSAAFTTASLRETALTAALVINLMLFLNFFSLPSARVPGSPRSLWTSARDAAAFGTFETSLNSVRYVDDIARITLQELEQVTPDNRPVVIVTTDVHRVEWFLNWRIARYYLPLHHFWIVTDQGTPPRAEHIRGGHVLESVTGQVRVPVPRLGRILWLLEPGGSFHSELVHRGAVTVGRRVLYMDVGGEAAPFRVFDYEFVPTDMTAAKDSP
jgi:hypothetical protein